MNPRCEKPGCGLEMDPDEVFHLRWVCPRNADAHALCARVAELEKDPDDSSWRYRYEDCQKALDVHQRLLADKGFPLLSLCEALGQQGGTVHQVLREVASLRFQLSAEQAAHAATKEELRKADEALFKSADWSDAHGYGFLAEFEAALARQAQRAADAAKEE